jgi:Ca-activated chloride channel family protein
MKTLSLLISSSLLWLTAYTALAQNADDFFNGGAQLYISNNIPDALQKVETGLKSYPDDVKLKKLEELLKQQQQQQNQQNQQQQNQQNKQNQSQQNKNSQNQQSQAQQQQQQNKQQQDQQKQNQQNSQQQQQNQQQQAQQQNAQNQQNAAQQAQQGRAMSPEEAKRLLDAQKGNEQVLRYQPKGQPQNVNPAIKDW